MVIKLYNNFAKKNNSTKRPTDDANTLSLNGTLKEPCSMISPVFSIVYSQTVAPQTYNYAYITAFGRYYFVRNWMYNEGLWECDLFIDVMASFRTEIGNLSEYILRTDSTDNTIFNEYISDSMYPASTGFVIQETQMNEDPFVTSITGNVASGIYVVGILSGDLQDAVGAVTYYAMTSQQFGALKQMLFSNDNLVTMGILELVNSQYEPAITDMSAEVLKTMYNPFQYIVSCHWFPFGITSIPDYLNLLKTTIKIGWWVYQLQGYRLQAQLLNFEQHCTLPNHPLKSLRGQYLNYAPFTRRTLFGRFGQVPVDCAYTSQGDVLFIQYRVDIITGQCRVMISVYDDTVQNAHIYVIAQREFLLAVPIQLAQVGSDYLGTAVSAINTAAGVTGSILSFNPTGAVSKLASGVYDTLSTSMPQMETSGSNGCFINAVARVFLSSQFFIPVDEDIHHLGRPVYKVKTINTLSGYVLCAEGDFDIACTEEERDMIKNYLTSGFFWE